MPTPDARTDALTDADLLLRDAEQPFSGWDFSYISATGRMVEAPLPWSYASIALPALRRARALLDMGTGGGEFLSRIAPLPPVSHATEGWPPNVSVATERLTPLGVQVHAIAEDDLLPLPDACVDLVLNRHESFDPAEVARVLQPGRLFITQQVGGNNDRELHTLLEDDTPQPFGYWRLSYAADDLQARAPSAFELLDTREVHTTTRFYDVGALAWYLQVAPWEFVDFSVERYRPQLHAIHARIERDGWLDVTCHRFLIVARRV